MLITILTITILSIIDILGYVVSIYANPELAKFKWRRVSFIWVFYN